MSDQLIGGMFNAAQDVGSRLRKTVAQSANNSIDDMFQRIASSNEGSGAYNKSDYTRLSFTSKSGMEAFANAMGEQGVTVNCTPVKLNGQWMVEMPKENSDSLINSYMEDSGRKVLQARDYDTSARSAEDTAKNTAESAAGAVDSFMINNLDYLGRAISGFQAIGRVLDEYGGNANNDIFTSDGAQFNAKKANTATVVNGDTVIIDGKVVTDQKTIDYVMRQYDERMDKAADILNKTSGLETDKNLLRMRENAQKIQDNMYGAQDFFAPDAKGRELISSNNLDNLAHKFTVGSLAGSGKEAELVNTLKKDLGLKDLPTTKEGILNLNEAFFKAAKDKGLNVSFVTASGKFNLKALDLPNVKAVFDEKTLQAIKDINSGVSMDGLKLAGGLLQKGVMKMMDDEDAQKLVQGTTKTVRYTKQASTTVHQYRTAIKAKVDIRKANRVSVNKADTKLHAPKKANTNKPKKGLDEKIDAARKAKLKARNDKAMARLKKWNNSKVGKVFNKVSSVRNNVLQKFAQTKLGSFFHSFNAIAKAALKKIAVPAIGIVIKALGCVVCLAVVIFLVQSLADVVSGLKKYIPSYFTKSVSFNLTQRLKNYENAWASEAEYPNESGFSSGVVANNWALDLHYGMDRQYLWDYVKGFNGEVVFAFDEINNFAIMVNPFYKIYPSNAITANRENDMFHIYVEDVQYSAPQYGGTYDIDPDIKELMDYLNESVNEFSTLGNGKLTSGFVANANQYGLKQGTNESDFLTTESGHTSNVKDIVTMTDIMFNMDMEESDDDEGLKNVMEESPAKLDWKQFLNNVAGGFKWFGSNFVTFWKNLFGIGEDGKEAEYITLLDATGVNKSYKTIEAYAMVVFNASHASVSTLNVSYLPVVNVTETSSDIKLNIGGTLTDWTSINGHQAAELGVCIHPVTHKHKIYYDTSNGTIAPYIEVGGTKYNLSTEDFGTINVNINDNYAPADSSDTLCLKPWTTGEDAWNDIVIYQNDDNTVKTCHSCWKIVENTSTDTHIRGYGIGSYDEDRDVAKQSAIDAAETSYNTNRNAMITAFNSLTRESYTLSGDKNRLTVTLRIPVFTPFENATADTELLDEDEDEEVTDANGDTVYGEDGNPVTTTTTSYQYKATVEGVAWRTVNITLERDCQEHTFKYCGGHVNIDTVGIAYSMTNEQLSMCAGYDDDALKPAVADFDFEANGYEELIGKHNSEAIQKAATPHSANINSFKAPLGDSNVTPKIYQSVQGSAIACQGIFNVSTDDLNKLKPSYNLDLNINIRELRDIFDADCSVLKGSGTLPWKSYNEYEGWSADNMTLAISRTTIDWNDAYGTDIDIELDRRGGSVDEIATLDNTEDVSAIVESLRIKYGDSLTEDREQAVKFALGWLGRGHYSERHQEHAFLSKVCKADQFIEVEEVKEYGTTTITTVHQIHFDANCTASDDEGFIKFILNRMGAMDNVDPSLSSYGSWTSYTSTDGLLPADILRHKVAGNSTDLVLGNLASDDFVLDALPDANDHYFVSDVLGSYFDERYVFVVGVLGSDVCVQGRCNLKAGTLLTVDLQLYQGIGTVRLHAYDAKSWTDLEPTKELSEYADDGEPVRPYFPDESDEDEDEDETSNTSEDVDVPSSSFLKNYYWVSHPDSFTKVYRPSYKYEPAA